MSNDDPKRFSRDYLIKEGLLQTEYEEANQEFRHRNQLLHNTFYLLVIAAGVFLGLFLRFGPTGSPLTLGGLIIASGVAANLIGNLFLKHYHERSSAEVVRMHAEWLASGQRDGAERPLSLEWGVAGGGAIWGGENGEIVRRGSHVYYIIRWPNQLLSAETAGMALVYTGVVASGIGAWMASSPFFTTWVSDSIGGLAIMVYIILYYIARETSSEPGNDPIY